jgi:hypothetical protein
MTVTGHLLDPDHLVQRVGVAEQLARRGLADDGHLGRALAMSAASNSPPGLDSAHSRASR